MAILDMETAEVLSPRHRRAYHLSFDGIISSSTMDAFRKNLRKIVDSGLDIIVDLNNVTYINSTGMGELLQIRESVEVSDRHLVLICTSPEIRQLFRLLGIDQVIELTDGLSSALNSLDVGPKPTSGPAIILPPKPSSRRVKVPVRRPAPKLPDARIALGFKEETFFSRFLQRCLSKPDRPPLVGPDRNAFAQFLADEKLDLVILDSDLPDFHEICAMLKTDARNGLVSVITIYSQDHDGREIHTFRIMEDESLVEPVDVREIMALLESEYERSQEMGNLLRQEVKLNIPSDARDIVEATKAIETMLEDVSLDDNSRNAVLYAVREAIDNARRHGNKNNKAKNIVALYTIDREKLTITISDEGNGFPYKEYLKDVGSRSPIEQARLRHKQGRQGGLGINLMVRCCDTITYEAPGNTVCLTKFF